MEFRILGPLEVLDDGRTLDVGGAKQRSLLAVLLLNANTVVSSDRLIDALWGDQPPETAAKAIQVHVSRLRRELGAERIETKAPGYVLRIGEGDGRRSGGRLAAPIACVVAWGSARRLRRRAVRPAGDREARGSAPRRAR